MSLVGELTEAKAADAELTEKRARASTELAAIVLAALELRLSLVFDALGCCAHSVSFLCRPKDGLTPGLRRGPEWNAESLEQLAGLVVIRRGSHDGDVHALQLLDL